MSANAIDFSLWCDFIHKDFLDSSFKGLIDSGLVNGATSNPSIFAQALKTTAYAENIRALKHKNLSPKAIYEEIALADIARASEIMRPIFVRDYTQGFISIEIDPRIADNAQSSIDEGKRLHKAINAPNVMIKVPATNAGYEVMNALASAGISVNATLIFSPEQAQKCVDSLKNGYDKCAKSSNTPMPQGVISVFVSRFDRAIQPILSNVSVELQQAISHKLGIMNALECYKIIEGFNAPHIRTLFASTGVKTPTESISHSYYINSLVLPHSINTAPIDAIESYKTDIGDKIKEVSAVYVPNNDEMDSFFAQVKKAKININALYKQLLDEGMQSFEKSFEELLGIL